ncbi:MAG: 4Fe-4S binding protein [Candidatus Helarchaeota archaeon]
MISDLYIPKVTDPKKCGYCAACEKTCPEKAIKIENNTFHLDVEKCLGRKNEFCAACVEICQRKILSMVEAPV